MSDRYDDVVGKSFNYGFVQNVENLPDNLLPYLESAITIQPLTGELLSVYSPSYNLDTYKDTIQVKGDDISVFEGEPFYYHTLHDPVANPLQTDIFQPGYYYDPSDINNIEDGRNYSRYYQKCHSVSFKYSGVSKTGYLIGARIQITGMTCVAGTKRIISTNGKFTSNMVGKYLTIIIGDSFMKSYPIKITSVLNSNEVDLEYIPTTLDREPSSSLGRLDYINDGSNGLGYVYIDTPNPLIDTPYQIEVSFKSSIYGFADTRVVYDWANITEWNMPWQYFGWKYLVFWDAEKRFEMGFEPLDNASLFQAHNYEKDGTSDFAKLYVMPNNSTTELQNGRIQYKYKGSLPSGEGVYFGVYTQQKGSYYILSEEGYENGIYYSHDYSSDWLGQSYYVPNYLPISTMEITRNSPDVKSFPVAQTENVDAISSNYVTKIGTNKYRFHCGGRISNLVPKNKAVVLSTWNFPVKQEKWSFSWSEEDEHIWDYAPDGDWLHRVWRKWDYSYTENYSILDYSVKERLKAEDVGNEVRYKVMLINPNKFQEVRKYRIKY